MRWFGFGNSRRYQALDGAEDFLLVTWDSCRYDTYRAAKTPILDSYGEARRAWTMATYTLPSHVAMFQGFLPHVFSPEPFYNRYCQQLWRICHRNVHVKPLVTFPAGTKSVVCGLQQRGYFTVGVAAMDWFRDADVLRDGFDRFTVTGTAARRQNDILFRQISSESADRPCFAFLNYGETHSPFRHEGMPPDDSGVDTRFSLGQLFNQRGLLEERSRFDADAFGRQVACAQYLDARSGEVLDYFRRRRRPTTVVICSDHGDCLGEDGLYGHAFYHEKVMEVPILIFRLNAPPHPPPEASVVAPGAR
jgi:sulfatase-like protein